MSVMAPIKVAVYPVWISNACITPQMPLHFAPWTTYPCQAATGRAPQPAFAIHFPRAGAAVLPRAAGAAWRRRPRRLAHQLLAPHPQPVGVQRGGRPRRAVAHGKGRVPCNRARGCIVGEARGGGYCSWCRPGDRESPGEGGGAGFWAQSRQGRCEQESGKACCM